jgi:hypothetical protein
MTVSLAEFPTAAGPLAGRLVIAGCSRRKRAGTVPAPALELYEGGSIPWLRARLGGHPVFRRRVRILSAEHGLLQADSPVLPYDRPLDAGRARQLAAAVTGALARDWAGSGAPGEMLVIAEPLYLVPLAGLLATPARIHWIPDPYDTDQAGRVLDQWGWP